MGLLVDGVWHDTWYDTKSTGGRFKRQESAFRDKITADGSSGYPAEAGRYHLYVSLACPWAHRTLVVRALKGLTDMIGVTVVDSLMGENGWTLNEGSGPVAGITFLHQLYTRAKPGYTGRVTVPVLWDSQRATIVNNESSEIIRMFNTAFDPLGAAPGDFYPQELRGEIDAINARVYADINNGVYKAGFATAQPAYEEAYDNLFAALDWLDGLLAERRYLTGARITEADWRLFTTLVRFDAVYHGHFKCNKRRIADYAHLSGYLRELYQVPGIAETVNFVHIKHHYYASHGTINPTGIVPKGPDLDLGAPHGRAGL